MVAVIFSSRAMPDVPSWLSEAPRLAPGQKLRLFTDGSCAHPTASHAGFAVVRDTLISPDAAMNSRLWNRHGFTPGCFQVVSVGAVPGSQSSNRAECCGVVQACRIANVLGSPPTDIFTDSAFALAEWERLERSELGLFPDMAQVLVTSWRRCYMLHKVRAHRQVEKLEDEELWTAAGDHVADQGAKASVKADYGFLQDMAAEMASQWTYQAYLHWFFARYLVDISLEESRLKARQRQLDSVGVQDLEDTESHMADVASGKRSWAHFGRWVSWCTRG